MKKLIAAFYISFRAIVVALMFSTPGVEVCADQSAPDISSSAGKAGLFLMQIAQKWSFIQTLKYEVDTKDTESDGFRTSIHETGHDRDVLSTHLTFAFRGSDYGWKSDTLVDAIGVHERTNIGGCSNGTLSVLFQGSRSLLMVTKNPKLQAAVPITGCNPMLEAFSFLITDDWQGLNCPEIDLNSLVSQNIWSNALSRVTSFTEETIHAEPCIKIVFGPESGNHDVVYFSANVVGFPLDWQHYEGRYLRREVSIGDALVTRPLPGGASITFPHLLTRRDYYDPTNPNVFCTSQQTLSLVAINEVIAEDELVIDPSLADAIYDRDNDKRISIPK